MKHCQKHRSYFLGYCKIKRQHFQYFSKQGKCAKVTLPKHYQLNVTAWQSKLDLGYFPFSKKFPFQPVELQMECTVQMEISGTNGRTSEVLHFLCSNRLERKLPFHLHKISVSIVRAYTNFLRHHDLQMGLQVFHPHGKSLPFDTENFRNFKPKIWLNGKRSWVSHRCTTETNF